VQCGTGTGTVPRFLQGTGEVNPSARSLASKATTYTRDAQDLPERANAMGKRVTTRMRTSETETLKVKLSGVGIICSGAWVRG
jgi:hypothetical protein